MPRVGGLERNTACQRLCNITARQCLGKKKDQTLNALGALGDPVNVEHTKPTIPGEEIS